MMSIDKTEQTITVRQPRKTKENSPAKRVTKPQLLLNTLHINGAIFDRDYSFACGNVVPIFEVLTPHALNQLIGYAKFNNRAYGTVFYRGECKLHCSIKPSLYRSVKKIENPTKKLTKLVQNIADDSKMKRVLKIDHFDYDTSKHIIEGMLQHYGIPTRFIDVIDNHWVALWMGLNQADRSKQINAYYHYTERIIPYVELLDNNSLSKEHLFQYILLIAVPYAGDRIYNGIQLSKDYIEIDLRQALPSVFLRPHAQHGLVVRRIIHESPDGGADIYDMAPAVIGIIKIRIDRAHEWLGMGGLLTQNNLFPPPAYDYGYDFLLSRSDLFDSNDFSVAQYV